MSINSGTYLSNWHSSLVQKQFISTITTFSKFKLHLLSYMQFSEKKKKFVTVHALQGYKSHY